MNGKEDESGSTATAMFIGEDMLFISHVGDSCAVFSQPFNSDISLAKQVRKIKKVGKWLEKQLSFMKS